MSYNLIDPMICIIWNAAIVTQENIYLENADYYNIYPILISLLKHTLLDTLILIDKNIVGISQEKYMQYLTILF